MNKKLTIFDAGQKNSNPHLNMFFDLNNTDYEFVASRDYPKLDIVVNTSENTDISAKIYLYIDLFHSYENQIGSKEWPKNWYHVTTGINKKPYVSQQVKSIDFIFNRTKAYYQNYPFRSRTTKWYYLTPDAYPTLDLPGSDAKTFIFLAPNKTYNRGRIYRTRLVDFLKQNFGNWSRGYGFIGNYDDNPDMKLYGHLSFKEVSNDSHDLFLLNKINISLNYSLV